MKILHCCLANFYIDGYSYQENIIPKYHRAAGYTVEILASTETYIGKTQLGYVEPSVYMNTDGIQVTRIPYLRYIPHSIATKLRLYEGVNEFLKNFEPDLIFIHGPQFLGAFQFLDYLKRNSSVRLVVDSHADFINSGKNWLSKNILHKLIYRFSAKMLEPHAEVFFGVLPLRVEFLAQVYKIDPSKIKLLVMGADITDEKLLNRYVIRERVRKELKIAENKFLLISGGRIEARKQFQEIVDATIELSGRSVHLVIFGAPVNGMEETYEEWGEVSNVTLKGWIKPEDVYDLLLAADLAVFPGTHSVLWEQALGVGLPSIFRRWRGIEHINLAGEDVFLEEGTSKEIVEKVTNLLDDSNLYDSMQTAAIEYGIPKFSYKEIAAEAIR